MNASARMCTLSQNGYGTLVSQNKCIYHKKELLNSCSFNLKLVLRAFQRQRRLAGKREEHKKLFTLLDLCVSSLRRGHANLLCIVPILTDDPRRESDTSALGSQQCAEKIAKAIGRGKVFTLAPTHSVSMEKRRGQDTKLTLRSCWEVSSKSHLLRIQVIFLNLFCWAEARLKIARMT